MQLEQSSFRIYHALLMRIPKQIFILSALTVFIVICINFAMLKPSSYENDLLKCYHKYYELTHPNLTAYYSKISNPNSTLPSDREMLEQFKLIQANVILAVERTKMLEKGDCIIELNFDDETANGSMKQQQDLSSLMQTETTGYLISNFALRDFNLSDKQLLKRHNIQKNRVILPEMDPGFKYIGMDEYLCAIEDFIWSTNLALDRLDTELKYKWKEDGEAVEAEIKRKQKNKGKNESEHKNSTGPQKKQNKKQTSTPDANSNSSAAPNAENDKEKKTNTLLSLIQTNLNQSDTTSTLAAQNGTNASTAEVPANFTNNILIALNSQKIYSKHRLAYRTSETSDWIHIKYPKTTNIVQKYGLFSAIFDPLLIICQVYIISIFIGLFFKYSYISILTILSIVFTKLSKYVGWVHRYVALMRRAEKNRIKLIIQVTVSIAGMYVLYAVGLYLVASTTKYILYFYIPPNNEVYSRGFHLNLLLVEGVHYVFFRTRTTLRFFSTFSIVPTTLALYFCMKYPYLNTSMAINFSLLMNIFFIFCFLFVEKLVLEDELQSDYKPSLDKPRMLFYMGYDLDWHRSIPPLWTTFDGWYDLSSFNAKERSYLDKDYQLLYGQLIGMDQPQQLPQQEDQDEEQSQLRVVELMENSGP